MLERWLRWHSVGMRMVMAMATVNMGMMMMMSWMVVGAEAAVAPAPAVVSNSSVLLLGGLLAYNSTIGIAAQAAIELAVSDVNAAGLLGGRQLVLHLTNTNCSAFQGAASGKQVDHQNLFQELSSIQSWPNEWFLFLNPSFFTLLSCNSGDYPHLFCDEALLRP